MPGLAGAEETVPDGSKASWFSPARRLLGARGPAGRSVGADEAARGYVGLALELLARCEDLHQGWLEQLEEQRRNERLANAAAVYHWHLCRLRDRLGLLEAPPALGAWHEALAAALDGAARATRLMSHGYRFHNVRRICDGGLLLEEARAQTGAVGAALAQVRDGTVLSEPAEPPASF